MNKDIARITVFSVLAIYLYIFMEWLFFMTKPSFLDNLSISEGVMILAMTPLLLVAAIVFPLLLIWSLASMIKKSQITKVSSLVALAVPSLIIAATAFLLIENFTYTLFKINVGSFVGLERYIYAFLFINLILCVYRILHRWASSPLWETRGRMAFILAGALVFLSVGVAAAAYMSAQTSAVLGMAAKPGLGKGIGRFPNILILSTDGLDANHMSAYGYYRETTPYIKSLLDKSLLAENCFANASGTPASVPSLLSGKLPTHTKVVYPPDIFIGVDAYQHLPGLLRKLGYRNAEISMRHYADPYDLNMRDAFNMVNGREENELGGMIAFPRFIIGIFMLETYFFEQTMDRIVTRLKHAFGIEEMGNPYLLVTETGKENELDSKSVAQLLDFIDGSVEPFFAHVHFMGTHGPKFYSPRPVFSKGQKQEHQWLDDFYDDAILDYDRYVKEVVQHLQDIGKFKDTLIILTSDHGSQWRTDQRIPLIILFPYQRYKGRITWNVQSVDIAATILNYLGVEVPDWMDGDSLLSGESNTLRPIVISHFGMFGPHDANGWGTVANYKAPFYSLAGISVVIGHKWYFFSLSNAIIYKGQKWLVVPDFMIFSRYIKGHTAPWEENELPSEAEVKDFIIDHLKNSGYDVSSLERH